LERTGHIIGFLAVAAACAFGLFQVSLWGPCAAAALLVLLSLRLHQPVYAGYERAGRLGAQSALLAGSIFNATLTCAAAYVAGRAIAWAWGI
jgi:hypothetical protein